MREELKTKSGQKMEAGREQKRRRASSEQSPDVIGKQAMLRLKERSRENRRNVTGIPDQMKQSMEERFGLSLDDVQVHFHSQEPARLHALAYTQGNQVYIGPGQEQHLKHELGHVVQQKQGRVRATGSVNGVPINDDASLEREADAVERMPETGHFSSAVSGGAAPAAQRKLNGKYGTILKTLPIPDGTCKALISELDRSDKDIYFDDQCLQSSFDPKTNTLKIRGEVFGQLIGAFQSRDYKTVSVILSNICHEMSHARDYVITRREHLEEDGSVSVETTMHTELRAWCREAISILEVNKAYGLDFHASNPDLIDGWMNLKIEMLDDLYSHEETNLIIFRIIQYLRRLTHPTEKRDVQDWLNEKKAEFVAQIQTLQASFQTNLKKIYGK